ncbi:kinase-like protein, partial [Hymenopellis radicata]
LLEITQGLKYLHESDPQITHADVRGANILIDSELHCRLADFGLSLVSETRLPGSSAIMKGSLRWLPPEMMDYSLFDSAYLTARDIYSFGCTVIEIYTGRPPFSHIKKEVSLI